MTEEKKHELSQLLSEAMQHIHIQKNRPQITDINVYQYKRLLHKEWTENEVPPILSLYFKPCITEETINVNLLNFMKEELSEYINVDDHIGICPGWRHCEFHHLHTQLLRIAICFGIENAVNEFNRCLTENAETIRYYTVLHGVEVKHEIQIFDGIRIVPLSPRVKLPKELLGKMPENLIEKQFDPGNRSYISWGTLLISDFLYSPLFLKLCISESRGPLKGSSQSPFIKVKERKLNNLDVHAFFEKICLALSLTLNTNVQRSTSWNFHDPRKLSNVSGIGSSGYGTVSKSYGDTKTFGTNQVDEVEHIFNLLYSGTLKNIKNIDRAIRRWLRSKTQRDPVDKMIDLRIALEALYLGDDASPEKGFRLSNYAAWHLGEDVEDRKKLQKFFKTIYDISSSSVHSESINDSKIRNGTDGLDRTEFITKAQDLCRDAILKFLKSESSPSTSKHWSDLILGDETFK